ncbi:hypothetical protein AX17_005699 [Amanita inopinata Kibby_2008]|nr:hypothetical protein AX17_005699 [Amanita inopinata Kibby_2008]
MLVPQRPVSAQSLRQDIETIRVGLVLQETEETWDRIVDSINRLTILCKDGACDFPGELIPTLRSLSRPLTNALNSERTRLSGPTMELIAIVASGLGREFDPLLPLYFPPLLSLCSRTNKIVVSRAKECIFTIIQSTQSPSILSYLLQHAREKASSLKLVVAQGTLSCLNCFNPPDLEKEHHAREVESLIRTTATDANADVRRVSREIFEAYKLVLPGRLESFTYPLSPTIKKYLDIKLLDRVPPDSIPLKGVRKPKLNIAHSTSLSSTSTKPNDAIGLERLKSSSTHAASLRTAVSTAKNIAPSSSVSRYTQRSRQPSESRTHAGEARRVEPCNGRATAAQTKRSLLTYPQRSMPVGSEANHTDSQLVPDKLATSNGPRRIPLPDASSFHQPISRPNSRGNDEAGSKSDDPRTNMARPSKSLAPQKQAKRCTGVSTNLVASRTTESHKLKHHLPITRPVKPSRTVSKHSNIPRKPATQRAVSQHIRAHSTRAKSTALKSARQEVHIEVTSQSAPDLPSSSDCPDDVGRVALDGAHPPPPPPSASNAQGLCTGVNLADNPTPTRIEKESSADETERVHSNDHMANQSCTEPKANLSTPMKMPEQIATHDSFADKTPISALLSSIEQGFLFTPCPPLSPPQSYLGQEVSIFPLSFPPRLPDKMAKMARNDERTDEIQRKALGAVEMNN